MSEPERRVIPESFRRQVADPVERRKAISSLREKIRVCRVLALAMALLIVGREVMAQWRGQAAVGNLLGLLTLTLVLVALLDLQSRARLLDALAVLDERPRGGS